MTVLSGDAARRLLALLGGERLDFVVLQCDLPEELSDDLARICGEDARTLVVLVAVGAEGVDRLGDGAGRADRSGRPAEAGAETPPGRLRMLGTGGDGGDASAGERAGRCLTSGDLTLYPEEHRAILGDREIALSPVSARILRVLMEHAPRVVPQELLIRHVWPNGDGDVSALAVGISGLRTALADDPWHPARIQHVEGYGFCINSPLE